MRTDKMVIAAFGTASTTKSTIASWSHKSTELDFLSVDYYTRLARTVEAAGFDLLFFDDRLALPGVFGNSPAAAVEKGHRVIKLDLMTVLGVAAAVTSRIGLGGTYSTTYHSPYHIARAFASLDHLSGGRAIWNIVTSLNHDEARNFGFEEHLAPKERYERADEFMKIVTGLWESWQPDALRYDRESGTFADPDSVSAINFKGQWYSSQGPLTVPRPPQGWPTLLQAGQSGPGMAFAGKWADLTFSAPTNYERAIAQYPDYTKMAENAGRSGDDLRVLASIVAIAGETSELAREKAAYVDSLFDPVEWLISFSEMSNIDFNLVPHDQLLTDEMIGSISGGVGIIGAQVAGARMHYGTDVTPLQLAEFVGKRPGSRFVGRGEEVAERMAHWFETRACDGFVVTPTHAPGAYADMGNLVIPHLRKQGLVADHAEKPATFRDRAGLSRRD
jgi:FMN-dependent oxidoreductase (nitrilotriacetate monooxygenase family)